MFNAIDFLNSPRNHKIKLGLSRISLLQKKLGNPEKNLRFVHVAGTNGKGSTCAFIESCLRHQGYKTGLFTSPYVENFEERIKVDNENIDKKSLDSQTLRVKRAADEVEKELGEYPTEFELMTSVALCYFDACECDICVVEVGLGGRFDSTNIINPEVCILTSIGMDHMNLLGDTIEKIAGEKGGIIKTNVDVVCAPQKPEALSVISKIAQEKNCSVYYAAEVSGNLEIENGTLVQKFRFENQEYSTSLIGDYQPQNATNAILALRCLVNKGFAVSNKSIVEGIREAKWPGRCEFFKIKNRDQNIFIIIDGAHNVDGAKKLVQTIQNCKRTLEFQGNTACVFGVLEDKDYKGIIKEIAQLSDEFYLYPPKSERALSPQTVRKYFGEDKNCKVFDSAQEALKEAVVKNSQNSCDSFVVCLGSLYSVGELKKGIKSLIF